ncbi:MAG: hypothetical protein GWN18_13425, partial [Thermoplasmata archaeon]|nr:hypothetical protein [Thermoplasmata archaeon]NIS13060.1 hypothetical protein [Thermoplasmata archaeon]NIS20965.1 hypothetical protein [Thermoplasmata archaeon]NIT78410.1 hypothetical protein [Thermoplasmata archaeon]NIU50018.1 hypothetical protein [Thermoplasmata archaeon]
SQGTTHLPAYGPYQVFEYQVSGPSSSLSAGAIWPFIIIIVALGVAYIFRQRLRPMVRRGLELTRLRRVEGA